MTWEQEEPADIMTNQLVACNLQITQVSRPALQEHGFRAREAYTYNLEQLAALDRLVSLN